MGEIHQPELHNPVEAGLQLRRQQDVQLVLHAAGGVDLVDVVEGARPISLIPLAVRGPVGKREFGRGSQVKCHFRDKEDTDEVPFTTAEGKGGRPVYIAQGYLYHCDKVLNNKLYARCHRWRVGCMGRAVLNRERSVVITATDHNGDHSTDEKEVLVRQFRVLLKTYAEACVAGNLKEAYDQAATELPSAAVHLTYTQVSRCMNDWRRKKWPKTPQDAKATLRLFQQGASMF